MGKTAIISIALFLFVIVGFVVFYSKQAALKGSLPERIQQKTPTASTKEQDRDEQASFAIFTNGTFRVFTASMYHNLSEDVFIQADNPNIVHVKKSGITWGDFFKTLPFSLTNECLTTGTKETFCTKQNASLKFYLNGIKNDSLLDEEIHNGDVALITYGSESEKQIQGQIDTANTLSN